MKNKKLSIVLASMQLLASSATAFAALPAGTVVIGNKAYSLKYANDTVNQDEIRTAVVAANSKIYIKEFDGVTWADSISGKEIDPKVIPNVEYKDGSIQGDIIQRTEYDITK